MKVNVPNTGTRNCERKTKETSEHGFTMFDMNHLLSVIWLSLSERDLQRYCVFYYWPCVFDEGL